MDFICPYTCSYRTSSGYCGSTGGWERCQYRQLYQPNTVVGYVPPLKKTNADRFRGMTDEKLAEVIKNPCDMGLHMPNEWCKKRNCGYQCSFDWLKQEASE